MPEIILIIIIVLAGPIIGSLIGIVKRPTKFSMHNMLAFAGGVMMAISLLELIPESIHLSSVWLCIIGIVIGTLVMYILDKIIPHIHPEICGQEHGKNLERTAKYLLLGIFLHNFPEGLAIGAGAITDFKLSLTIALAIAIHDIPEAICTSAPYYHVSGKRLKSFLLSASTAIPTIIGFALAFYIFQNIPQNLSAIIIAATAGIMIYISADELIPTSCCRRIKACGHSTIFSFIIGVLFVIILGTI